MQSTLQIIFFWNWKIPWSTDKALQRNCESFVSGKCWHWMKLEPVNPIPAGNYMFKVYNRNARTRCEICSKLTIKTPELWTYFTPCSSVSFRGKQSKYAWKRNFMYLCLKRYSSKLLCLISFWGFRFIRKTNILKLPHQESCFESEYWCTSCGISLILHSHFFYRFPIKIDMILSHLHYTYISLHFKH